MSPDSPLGAGAKHRIARDTARLAVRTVVQQILGSVRGLILPNLLGPGHFGSVATLLLIERYSTHVNLGITAATLYQAPARLAAGEDAEALDTHHVVVGFSAVMGCLAGAAVFVAAWWARGRLSSTIVSGLLISSLLPPLIAVRGPLVVWARARNDFVVVARAGFIASAALFVLTIGGGWLWQMPGVIAGHVGAHLLLVCYLARREGHALRPVLRLRRTLELLRYTAPVTVLSLLMIYLVSVDRLAIATTLPLASVGFYAIGQSLTGVLSLIPTALSEALAPTVIASASRSQAAAGAMVQRATISVAIVVAVASALLIAAVPGVVRVLFPSYTDGITAAQILCLVSYFEALGVGSHYAVTSRRGPLRAYIAWVAMLAALAHFLLPFVAAESGITGVAGAMVFITALRTLWVTGCSERIAGTSGAGIARTVATLLLLGAVVAAVPLTVVLVVPTTGHDVPATVAITMVRVATTLMLFVTAGMLFVPAHVRTLMATAMAVLPVRRRPVNGEPPDS